MDLAQLTFNQILELANHNNDNDIAMMLYQYLANKNDPRAIIKLGHIYQRSTSLCGAFEMYQRAGEIYQSAVNKNTPRSLIILAKLYLDAPPICFKEYERMLDEYYKAIDLENDNDSAILLLGRMFEKQADIYYCAGIILQNFKKMKLKAYCLYERAYQMGNRKAIYYLANAIFHGYKPTMIKEQTIIALCERGINEGNTYAMLKLANHLYEGNRRSPNTFRCIKFNDKSTKLYQDAIVGENIMAMFQYGNYCKNHGLIKVFRQYYLAYYHTRFINFNLFFDLKKYYIEWHTKLHIWWPFNDQINNTKCVINLLLISKYRRTHGLPTISCFYKGVMMIVIKDYCMLTKKIDLL